MQTEHVILLNAQGVPTGTLEKYAAHTADTRGDAANLLI